MDEPVGIVLAFLRQHNFEKAEEALRLELQARHSLENSPDSHVEVDVAFLVGDAAALKDCPGKELLPHLLCMKPESSTTSGIVDNRKRAYADWEFKSCSNNDCVLEFKKPDPQSKRSSPEVFSNHDHNARQNGMKPRDSVCEMPVKGRSSTHFEKPTDLLCSFWKETAMGQGLLNDLQRSSELTHDDPLNMRAIAELGQDLAAFKLNDCSSEDEPRLLLQASLHGAEAFSPRSYDQNIASSTCHSFFDNNWLEHDAAKFLEPRESSLQLLPASEEYELLEEKKVVHDCIDYIKALALEDQKKSSHFLKDTSLPWEINLQAHYAGGQFLNERQIDNRYNVNSSVLRTSTGSFSLATGITDSFGLDKVHTNALFEPAFNLGSFLDIPVGQETESPGEKEENGTFQLCCNQNGMQGTPELLSGFATLGDEPTDPGMGYTQEFWDSDMYEDDEDPGYERQEIEDEDWFLAHEQLHASDKIGMTKGKTIGDIASQNNGGNEMIQGKEDLSLFSREVLNTGVSDFHHPKLGCDVSSSAVNLRKSMPNNVPILSKAESLSYDGHLMDAEELKFMRDEPVWQDFSSQFDKHAHYDKARETDANDTPFDDFVSGRESISCDQSKTAIEQLNLKRDFLYEVDHRIDWVVCCGSHEAQRAESTGIIQGIASNPKLDFLSRAVIDASGYSNLSNIEDARSCSGSVHLQDIDVNRPLITGCLRYKTTSNQGMIVDCPPQSFEAGLFPEENIIENSKSECTAMHHNHGNEELSAARVLQNRTSSNSPLLLHSEDLNHVPSTNDLYQAMDETIAVCACDCAVNELAVNDGEINSEQGESQLFRTEEDEYEVFSLRIIHRKNRTGFEEEKHFQVVLNSVVAGRYLVTEYLGSAAFSKAVQARDLQTGMDVCMKIIKNNKDFFDQSLDEIKLLKYINKNDPADKHHLLRLYDYFYHREHLFIVCELLRANLYEFHKFNKESGGEPYFTMSRLQLITRQCLEALEYLHCLGLVHCDLKPENILIKSYSRCEIKVIDLGSSCFQTDHLCSYVQSRSYRAPEVILGLPYNEKIDIWSLGCILAELCSGNVLFQNDSLATLLARVIGIIEPISGNMILKGKESHKYFTKNSMLYERNQDTNKLEYLIPKKSSLQHRLPSGDQGFVDFVGYLLQVNPENRPSASEALKHPWLTHPYDPICI